MIRVDGENIEITGFKPDVLTEFTHIMRTFLKQELVSEKEIDNCVKLAKLSSEELRELAEEKIKKVTELLDMLHKLKKLNKEADEKGDSFDIESAEDVITDVLNFLKNEGE